MFLYYIIKYYYVFQMSNAIASAAAGPSNSIATRAQTSASRTSSLPLTRPQSTLPQKPSTTASKLAPTAIKPVIQASKSLTTSAFTTTKPVSSASLLCYEDPCVICHDEMSDATKNVSLDCGHKFHHDVSRTSSLIFLLLLDFFVIY